MGAHAMRAVGRGLCTAVELGNLFWGGEGSVREGVCVA